MGLVDVFKNRSKPKTALTRQDLRSIRPLRSASVTIETHDDGTAVLESPLETSGRGLILWMAKRTGVSPKKQFELEPVGLYVWTLCDGKHTFEAISRALCSKYKMSRPEADAALASFLETLGQRGLITVTGRKSK